ncbi:MAG: alpha/beta hydrolase, partial [Dehalococcoidia bacterium]|nr:alpha/beta hydrolase [Dehalococcoidia bacterium]
VAKVRLVAHDWGAVIGWNFCMSYPQRVERYVALSVGHPNAYARGGWEQKRKGWYVLFFQLRGFAEWALRRGDWRLFRRLTGRHDEIRHCIALLRRPGRLTAALDYYRANLGMLLRSDWPGVRVPVCGVWSSNDAYLAETQMLESRRFVTAPWRYERIDGVGHWLQLDAPERVNAVLVAYLASRLPEMDVAAKPAVPAGAPA